MALFLWVRVNIGLRQMVCGWSYRRSDFEIKMYKCRANFNLVLCAAAGRGARKIDFVQGVPF